jgi:hypothetical protein
VKQRCQRKHNTKHAYDHASRNSLQLRLEFMHRALGCKPQRGIVPSHLSIHCFEILKHMNVYDDDTINMDGAACGCAMREAECARDALDIRACDDVGRTRDVIECGR